MAGVDAPGPLTLDPERGAQDLPAALAVQPGPRVAVADAAGARELSPSQARSLAQTAPVLVAHAALTARRLGLGPPSRSADIFDVLELFAFVRPARDCAPSAVGLARALALPEPRTPPQQAKALRDAALALLDDLARSPTPSREALAVAQTLERAGWAWGRLAVAALRSRLPDDARPFRGSGLDVWARLPEWEDEAPQGEPGSAPLTAQGAQDRLSVLLARQGLAEARPAQRDFAGEAAFAFQPREAEGEPRFMIAEAGTGVGKTLGYLAPASLWAEENQGAVWVSTYTRALQRQIERESAAVFPDPAVRARKAVVRKGRENYACLLNLQETVQAAQLGAGDLIGAALVARWARATKDGDMTGGDFPAWLPSLFAVGAAAQAGPAALVDRRGECLHAGCAHYRTCFVEKAIRASRRADIVIANHALVMTQAAYDGGHAARRAQKPGGRPDAETAVLKRIVFDEGHHLFEAADSAFSACLSGQEAAELRRWIRGPEGRRRGRGLELRLAELVADNETARQALTEAVRAAAVLPGEGWSGRLSPPVDMDAFADAAAPRPHGPVEAFLAAVVDQIRARTRLGADGAEAGAECAARPAIDAVREAAPRAADALAAVERPLITLAQALEDLLDQEADTLESASRARIEGALRGLDRRARVQLPAWRAMLRDLVEEAEDAQGFVDWFEAVHAAGQGGRLADAAFRRHYVDPTEPLHATVVRPAHGVLVTSATLSDPGHDSPFALAELRTGAARLAASPKLLKLASPFDYANNARALVVTDVGKDDPRQIAAAMRELFLASGGGALGLFTAIRRLRAVYERMAAPLAEQGLPLYAQHVDPLEVGALVDIFRAEEDACLLGTDAIRDGVDVPGRSLRLLVFDRLPWPRPDLLHKARRERFGGRLYDDAVARGRLAQAFGRLIRRADDRGVFVLLDAAAPTRLFSALPEGVALQRVSLVEAIETVKTFLA
jgi:ATP-dependent DNA helicase DinG